MTYDVKRAEFTKEPFYLVVLQAPYCGLTYGVAPCAASGPVGSECYNTFKTCQDLPNYDPELKGYTFCSARSPLPVGLPVGTLPTVQSVTFTAPTVDVTGGLGVRASVAVTMGDAPSGDILIDKYVTTRSYIASERGTWWGKWRSRNPYYEDLPVTVYVGYLNEDGSYSADNMQPRAYIVSGLQVGNGKAKIDGRDPLKLAEGLKAQYPLPSSGTLEADLVPGVLTATLSPAGVGDAEYTTEGFVRVSSEVMAFTRVGDVLTLVREQYNTTEQSHSAGDTVQLCKRDNDRIDRVIANWLTTAANVPTAFIPYDAWGDEADANYPGDIDRLITEPEDVEDLIKEVCETVPSYIYWDERTSLIQFKAVKAPPIGLPTLNERDNFTGVLTYADQLRLRASRILVYFGQINPTVDRDQTSNYTQLHIREDADAAAAAGSTAIRTVYSRWLNNFNKAGAVTLATRLGRRFAQAPRLLNFTMTSKDNHYWLGSEASIEHSELQTPDGGAGIVPAQVVSVAQKKDSYVYQALELYWGESLPGDAEDGVDLVVLGADLYDVNLRTIYNSLYPDPTIDSIVRFVIDTAVEVGSTSATTYSIDTGLWPVGMAPIQLEVRGITQGRGGRGGSSAAGGQPGQDGGTCIYMRHALTIRSVTGRIAGGGGGGGGAGTDPGGGGGGAGSLPGEGGTALGGFSGDDGTRDAGGLGGGGAANGGGPAEPGEDSEAVGGAAGAAIITNGYTLTIESGSGNILGAII